MNLYPYQEEGARWLAEHRRAYLADVPGLGKTAQAITAASIVGAERPLVLCPASALPVWRAEIAKWSLRQSEREWTLVSYGLLQTRGKEYAFELAGRGHDLLIADEAHFMKNRQSKRARSGLFLANRMPRVWLLSGTPIPNDPSELYAPLRAVWPDVLQALGVRSWQQYLDKFCEVKPTDYGPKVFGAKNVALLREYIEKIMLRRTVEEVGYMLPALRIDIEPVDINLVNFAFEVEGWGIDIEFIERYIEQEGKLPPLDEHVSRLRRILGEMKAERVAERLREELEADRKKKIVVMTHHTAVIDTLKAELRNFNPVVYDGRTRPGMRGDIVNRFQNQPVCRVFIGQLTAAGTAITLTAAHEIVLAEQSWSPEDNMQAIKRVHRISQDHPCRARMIVAEGTIDEAVLDVLARKQQMIAQTYGTAQEAPDK